ncbi:MAG: GAF domain-containing protein [Deltaproteobacteria bacterium]|nr:GAF domain-containing protein [Deltaproteobacteria bacterium]
MNEYVREIHKIAKVLSATNDREKLCRMIVKSAAATMHAKGACLFLASDETRTQYTIAAQTGLSRNYVHTAPGRTLPIMKMLKKSGYLHYRDAINDDRLQNRESKIKEGIGSILVVPVMVRDDLLGCMALYTSDIRDFSDKEIEFFTVLADMGGLSIDKADRIAKLRNATRIFLKLASDITGSRDIKEILETLTKDVAESMNVKASSIRLLDESRTTLRLAASYGLSERYLNKGPISAEKSIAEALQGKPVVVKNAATDPGVQYRAEKKDEGIVTILSVPIKSRDEVVGVLRLYSATSRIFSEGEIQYVMALAHMGGVAIQNMQLCEMLKDDVKDLRENSWIFRTWF